MVIIIIPVTLFLGSNRGLTKSPAAVILTSENGNRKYCIRNFNLVEVGGMYWGDISIHWNIWGKNVRGQLSQTPVMWLCINFRRARILCAINAPVLGRGNIRVTPEGTPWQETTRRWRHSAVSAPLAGTNQITGNCIRVYWSCRPGNRITWRHSEALTATKHGRNLCRPMRSCSKETVKPQLSFEAL